MKSLPARPIVIEGESAAGLLMRAVDENGYSNLQSLLWAYMKNSSVPGWAKSAYVNPGRYKAIADMFGIKLDEDSFPFFSRVGPTCKSARNYHGIAVPENLFREDGCYYCPDCLKEKSFWRKDWTLKAYAVCTTHNKFLLKACNVCGKRLDPWRRQVRYCKCGADLSEMESQTCDEGLFGWWLEWHRNNSLHAEFVDATLMAIEEIDGGGDSPLIGHSRMRAVKRWIDDGDVDNYLLSLINERAKDVHPRIQVLPMAKSPFTELHRFSSAILSKCRVVKSSTISGTGKYMKIREAELALGVSRAQFKKFIERGVVKPQKYVNRKAGYVCFDTVNKILYELQPEKVVSDDKVGRKQTESVASMVESVLSGERESCGFDIAVGLNTLKLVPTNTNAELTTDEWLDVGQASELLDTYPDAIRFLVRAGKLSARDRDLQGRKRLIVNRKAVELFHEQFVFAGALAKSMDLNPTNLAEKLMSLGIRPVSGPRVDGALVYLFSRAEVDPISAAKLKAIQGYETHAGKKKTGQGKSGNPKAITLAEAAKGIGISIQQAKALVRKNILCQVESKDRSIMVSRKSFLKLEHTLNRTDLISVEDAAAMFAMPVKSFQSLWVNSGVLKAIDIGLGRRINLKELESLKRELSGKVTAADAGKTFSMHRSFLPNLEKAGEIQSVKVGNKSSIRLYERSDILNIQQKIECKSDI